jgi:WD40 repeat protein
MARFFLGVGLLFWLGSTAAAQEEAGKISFLRDVLPILKENCLACHDAKLHKGKYDMTTFTSLMKGGSRGEAVVAGKPEESFLWTLPAGQEEPKMPPKDAGKNLTAQQLGLLERWIKEGAKFDGTSPEANLLTELRRRWQPPVPPKEYSRPVPVRSLVFSPDGKYLLSTGYYEILFWEVATGKLAARLRTRAERANAMLFVDGETLAVAGGRPGQEGDVRLYRLRWEDFTGETCLMLDGSKEGSAALLHELLQTGDEVLTLALNSEGNELAAAGCDRTIRVWDVNTRKLLHTIENHADAVCGLAFSSDGQRLFSASRDKTAKVWDFAKKATVATFAGHQNMVYDVLDEQGGRTGLSVGEDGQLRIWRTEGNPQQMQLRAVPAHVRGAAKIVRHPGQTRVATAGADGVVRLWNLPNGNPQQKLVGHTDWVYALTFSPDGNLLASGAWNGEIRLWNVNKGTLVRTILAGPGLKPTLGK